MNNALFRVLITCVFVCGLALATIQVPRAQSSSLLWQTTFNCADWNQTMGLGDSNVCAAGDGISGSGAWAPAGHPNGDEITANANYPGGGGAKGFRHWRCDGTNCNGGGLRITFSSSNRPEVWLRFYMRYQAGFKWSPLNYSKELYVNQGSTNAMTVGFHGSDGFGIATISPSRNIVGAPGWTSTMGTASDGLWHCYEAHMKADTNGSNGIAEAWVDSQRSVAASDVNYQAMGFSSFILGENQATPSNGGDMYTDYDDVAVSVTGQIGCGSGSAAITPAAPTNVRVIH